MFFLHVLGRLCEAWPGSEPREAWDNVFFFNVDTFGIDFHVISGLFLEFRAHESVEFRNLAHQVQRNANFGSRSNCVIC